MVKPVLILTIGDPNGIGPEVALKALARDGLPEADFVLMGQRLVWEMHARQLGLQMPDQVRFVEVTPEPYTIAWGKPTAESGKLSMQAVAEAVEWCKSGRADAMITAPISKEAIYLAGYPFPGHTEFIAEKVAAKDDVMMMMVCDDLRIGLVTTHIPLRDVADAITPDAISDAVYKLDQTLRHDFGIENPNIAILGLNPHAGDGGVLGQEEVTFFRSTVATLRLRNFCVSDPWPADGFFATRAWKNYDAVLAMYHDQGLIPFKTIAFERGVNYSAGLPIIRTSPDHGTAFGIAGTGVANPSSMLDAIQVAAKLSRVRKSRNERA